MPAESRRLTVPMTGRDPSAPHRAATPLELFFDLVFVVAIAQAATELEHAVVEAHLLEAVVGYLTAFFAIWWAWLNFTWFASAYDTDDPPYRLAVFVQMAGALVIAAGVPRAFTDQDFVLVAVGYAVARLALVVLWLRVARDDPGHRDGAVRYGGGVAAVQVAWLAWLAVPTPLVLPGFVLLVLVEAAIPVWAERASPTGWHPEHVAERYGLMTIIVLGESVLASTIAVQQALDGEGGLAPLVPVVLGGGVLVAAMWWLYFDNDNAAGLEGEVSPFLFGYGHYVIHGAGAATGAGIVVAVEVAGDHGAIGAVGAGLAVAVPVALYLVATWLQQRRHLAPSRVQRLGHPVAAVLVLLAPVVGAGVLGVGLVVAALVVAVAVRPAGQPFPVPRT